MLPVVVLRAKVLEILKKKVQTSTLYLVKSYIMQIDKISNALNTKVEFPFFSKMYSSMCIYGTSHFVPTLICMYMCIYMHSVSIAVCTVYMYISKPLSSQLVRCLRKEIS